jgi:hypothetical protein
MERRARLRRRFIAVATLVENPLSAQQGIFIFPEGVNHEGTKDTKRGT